jgi:hypothetical protein
MSVPHHRKQCSAQAVEAVRGLPPISANDLNALQESLPPGHYGAARRAPPGPGGMITGMVAPQGPPEGSGRVWGPLRESMVGGSRRTLTMLRKSHMRRYQAPQHLAHLDPQILVTRISIRCNCRLVSGIPRPDSRKRGFRMLGTWVLGACDPLLLTGAALEPDVQLA